jgi:hypothetical protein
LQEARSQLADLSTQQPDITSLVDRDTALRLQDIERDLGQPALARKQRASLEQEREMILGTVDPNDRLPKQAEREQARQVKQLQDRIAKLEQQHGEARATADAAIADLRRKLGRHGEEFQPQQVMDATPFEEPADFAAALQRADLMRQARIVREHVMPEEGAGGRRGLPAPEDHGAAVGSSALERPTTSRDNLARIDREARALIAGVPTGKPPVARVKGDEIAPASADVRTLLKAVRNWYRATLAGKSVERADLGKINFTRRGMNEAMHFGANPTKLRLFPAVPEVIEKGDYVGSEAPRRNKRREVVRYHFIEATVEVGGEPHRVRVTIEERPDGKLYYNHDLPAEYRHGRNEEGPQSGPRNGDDNGPSGAPAGRSSKEGVATEGAAPAPTAHDLPSNSQSATRNVGADSGDINLQMVDHGPANPEMRALAAEHEQADQGVKEAQAIQGCLGGPKEGGNG